MANNVPAQLAIVTGLYCDANRGLALVPNSQNTEDRVNTLYKYTLGLIGNEAMDEIDKHVVRNKFTQDDCVAYNFAKAVLHITKEM